MSHYINCTIDTTPMANELSRISKHVNHTTEAVVSMRAAVIAEEKIAADRVCDNVNRGFHTLMLSQVTQKVAQLQSNVNSHLLRLNQQTKQLLAIKDRMERDYQRTAARYTRTFGTLNKELHKRVQELDQPIFKFATVEVQTTSNRMNNLVGTIPIAQSESVALAQTIAISSIKSHGKAVLESSGLFVGQMEDQKALTNRILLDSQQSKDANIMSPVLICESQGANSNAIVVQMPSNLLGTDGSSAVKGIVFQKMTEFNWKESAVSPEVQNEYARLVDESSKSKRVKDMMLGLMKKAGSYKTI